MNAKVRPYEIPLTTPYRWAGGEQTSRTGLLVRVEADGHTGWGEVAPPIHEPVDTAALAARGQTILDRLETIDLESVDDLRLHSRLRAGITTALLDLAARQQEVPLSVYLADQLADRLSLPGASGTSGASGAPATPRTEVPVNALVTATGAKEAAAAARTAVDQGFTTLKVKCTADRDGDLERMAAVRAAVGPDVTLRLDANGSWDLSWALAHLQEVAVYDIQYVEQPVPPTDPSGLARLRRASPVPLAWDESAKDRDAVVALLDAEAADYLILKPQRLGGLDRTLELATLAHSRGVPCVITNSIETAIGRMATAHAAAVMPEPLAACGIATEQYLAHDVAVDAPVPRDGMLQVPQGPGLGIHVEASALAPA